jgi:PAS domain S-box-containing protein
MMGVGIDITERKKAEVALLEEKRFTETLLDGLPNIFYLYDADLRLRRWNRNHETTMGFSAEELRGRYIGEWFATEESRAKGIGGARKILSEVRQGEHENSLLHKNGHEMPYILTGVRLDTPEGPMMMGVGVDITERIKAEEALRQSEEKFRAIFHSAPVGIFRTSFAGQLIEANATLAHMHGCASAQEYIAWAKDLGKERYAHPEDRQRLLEALLKTPLRGAHGHRAPAQGWLHQPVHHQRGPASG